MVPGWIPGPEIAEPVAILRLLAFGATTTAVPPLCIAENVNEVETGIDAVVLLLNPKVNGVVPVKFTAVTLVTVVPVAMPVPEIVCPTKNISGLTIVNVEEPLAVIAFVVLAV